MRLRFSTKDDRVQSQILNIGMSHGVTLIIQVSLYESEEPVIYLGRRHVKTV